jgi:hypothetical protein
MFWGCNLEDDEIFSPHCLHLSEPSVWGNIFASTFFSSVGHWAVNILCEVSVGCSIRLTTFDAAKNIINASEIEFERLVQEEQKQLSGSQWPCLQ